MKAGRTKSTPDGHLSLDRVIFAIRGAAEMKGRGLPLKLVNRAARSLGISPSTLRELIRKHPELAAEKARAEEAWRASIDAKLEEVKKSMNGREREMFEAVQRGEALKGCKINFALIDEVTREMSLTFKNLKL